MHLHRYSKWSERLLAFGYDLYQRKVCLVCGKVKQRRVGLGGE